MGYSYCGGCGLQGWSGEFEGSCCGVNADDGGWCNRCTELQETSICGKCNVEFCGNHGDGQETECCGLMLCGSYGHEFDIKNEDEMDGDGENGYNSGAEGCHEEHIVYRLKNCGHVKCTYFEGTCYTCSQKEETLKMEKKKKKEEGLMIKDKKLVVELLTKVKSKQLKQDLKKWVAKVPKEKSAAKKAKDANKTKKTPAKKASTAKKTANKTVQRNEAKKAKETKKGGKKSCQV